MSEQRGWAEFGVVDIAAARQHRWWLPGTPLAAAMSYFAFGAIWILLSDHLLLALFATKPTLLAAGQTDKGLIFVTLSTAIVYLLSRRSRGSAVTTAAVLTAAQQLRAEILDALPDPVVTIDPEGRMSMANTAAARAIGCTQAEILGRPFQLFVATADRHRTTEAFIDLVRGRRIGLDVMILRQDGAMLPFEIHGVPLKDREGKVIMAVASGRDISERVAAHQKLRDHLFGLEATLCQTIGAIAATVEKRDPYVAGHQERVAKLALAIADRMNLDAHRREGLRLAALCHDIGKIQIPSEILSKPSKLTEAEFALIRAHPNAGYDILSKVDFPWPIAEIVRQHHERCDGSGYPCGLIGDEILIEARILAVADTVEAMTSHRPYRPAVGLAQAIKEIRRSQGILLDAAAVDACLHLLEQEHFGFAA